MLLTLHMVAVINMHIEIHFKKTVEEMPLLDHGFIINANIFQPCRPSSRQIDNRDTLMHIEVSWLNIFRVA